MTISSADCGDVGATAPQRHQSVIVLSAGDRAPQVLLSALARRQLKPVVVDQPPGAMVELAERPVLAVVVVEPSGQPRLTELVEAVRRYYPSTACWQFASSANGKARLSQLKLNGRYRDDKVAGRAEKLSKRKHVTAQAKSAADTRMDGSQPAERRKVEVAGSGTQYQQDEKLRMLMSGMRSGSPIRYGLISEEELEMLLAPEGSEDRDAAME